MQVRFYSIGEIADADLKFAVVAARHENQWLFCRHKLRQSWEIPGGHREHGETIEAAARRELWEETGALCFKLQPVCVYEVDTGVEISCGMLFYAVIEVLGALPGEMEIGELMHADMMPQILTYPRIQPYLFEKIQDWLNKQSAGDELWDLFDENRCPTGRTQRRADPMKPGDYRLVVHVWLQNQQGDFLLTRRAPNKGYANLWECTGGSAVAGEDSRTAAIREVREETGLTVHPDNGICIMQLKRTDSFLDVWFFSQDFSQERIVLQAGEISGAQWVSWDQLLTMQKQNMLIPLSYLNALSAAVAEKAGI